MGDLFLGFQRNLRALVNVGWSMLLVAEIVIVSRSWCSLGPADGRRRRSGTCTTPRSSSSMLKGKEWILARGLRCSSVLVKGALWFAPPLIAFHGMSATHAIRWSVYAALSNLGAMLVYGARALRDLLRWPRSRGAWACWS